LCTPGNNRGSADHVLQASSMKVGHFLGASGVVPTPMMARFFILKGIDSA